jgi:hypothetical protein
MNDRTAQLANRTTVAAIAAGLLLSASVAAELIHPVERDGQVINLPLSLGYVVLYGAGAICLTVALRSLDMLHRAAGRPLSRGGSAGVRTALAGSAMQILFSATAAVIETTTRESPDAAFVFFGVGFLLLIIGSVLLALGLRRAGLLGSAWAFPLAGAAGGILAILVEADPFHDIGLLAFFSAWVGVGLAVAGRSPLPGGRVPITASPVVRGGRRGTMSGKHALSAVVFFAAALVVAPAALAGPTADDFVQQKLAAQHGPPSRG